MSDVTPDLAALVDIRQLRADIAAEPDDAEARITAAFEDHHRNRKDYGPGGCAGSSVRIATVLTVAALLVRKAAQR